MTKTKYVVVWIVSVNIGYTSVKHRLAGSVKHRLMSVYSFIRAAILSKMKLFIQIPGTIVIRNKKII